MVNKDYKVNKERAEQAYERVKEAYPEQVGRAHDMVVGYLSHYDRHRMRVFLGEVADKNYDGYSMENALLLISSMLYQKDKGNPEADEITIDCFARAYLFLPFAVVEGGKS